MRTKLQRAALLCVLAIAMASSAAAQSTTGTIQGTIRDQQSAVVPGGWYFTPASY